MSKHKELLIRLYITVFVVVLVALALSYKVVRISAIEGDRWRAKGDSLYVKYFPVEADRGDILSRNGELLATSLPLFEIRMDTKANGLSQEIFSRGVDSLAYQLSKYANTSWSQTRYRNYLIKQRNKGARYLLIKREANYAELEHFKQFPIFRRGQNKGGLITVRKSERLKPYGYLAERTLGSVRDNVQPVGLEGYFDEEMRGRDGMRLMQKVRNAWIPVNQQESVAAQRGADLNTTIDIRMQDIVESALMSAVVHHKAAWGTAVLMEIKTGAIRAIANLDRASGGGYYEGSNHAVGSATEPGSTFKLVSVMALLEDGYADLDTRVDLHNGKKVFYGHEMSDSHWHPHREVDMRQAFEISSNVGIATLADDAYARKKKSKEFIAKINQFGLNRTTGIRIPGEAKPYIKEAYNNDQQWSSTSVAWMSHGYELKVTPLQLLTFYSAVANDGKMMRPYLAESIVKDGKTLQEFGPEVAIDKIAKIETVAKARELLEGVMLRGTGKSHQSEFVTMAGKTGTAVLDYFRSGEGRKKYQGSFVGYFPAEDPEFGLIVLLNDPRQNGFYGGAVALPAFKEIAEHVMALTPTEYLATHKDSTTVKESYTVAAFAHMTDIEEIAKTLKVEYSNVVESDWVSWEAAHGNELAMRSMDGLEIPDLRGMGLKDAVFLLENAGLEVQTRGVGKVKKQSVKAGKKVSKGTRIQLVLG